ncbi:hypothetical protein B0H13DRAFT_2301802 [Mycena leptocephala]|nr:hypothetical protein B0H13DRAFT_2301802 [Mycena leptocephala]
MYGGRQGSAEKCKATHGAEGKCWKKREELRAYGLLLVDEDYGMDCDDKGEVGGGSENWRLISWIWTLAGTEGSDTALGRWAKSFACTQRWTELRLVSEEFLCIGVSFDYEAAKWEQHAGTICVQKQRGLWPTQNITSRLTATSRLEGRKRGQQRDWRARLERDESARAMQGLNAGRGVGEEEEEEEDEQGLLGDMESDEEYILGREGYD